MFKKIVIIHFQPLELYPPIQNLINFFGCETAEHQISIITTGSKNKIPSFQTKNIRIFRFGKSGERNVFFRYFNYFIFYSFSLIKLIIKKPNRIFYFETLSSYPAFLYKKYFNRNTEILIHYHEYSSPQEIAHGMKLNKIFHEREKYLYPDALWISHTNEHRMELFKKDEYPVLINNAHILPNYPPASWQTSDEKNISEPLKIIMIGALGFDTMYVKEFAEWIIQQNGKVIWDIYSFTISSGAKSYLESLHTKYITLKESVEYKKLPEVLKNYNVGVILYKGHIPNYIYNAPNKLFEYHVSGLDVWFPEKMTGAFSYIKTDSYPKILPVNFEKLSDLKTTDLTNRDGLQFIIRKYSSEIIFKELQSALFA
ncbi:MAG TPA: hypothetical protein VK787_16660 [Puia sp.]|jgi:hypothetical protein|nr:hypothetical protein [Puia sp.]